MDIPPPYIIVCRQGPCTSPAASAALDLLLTLGAFDQEPALALVDDGVFQLLPGQDATKVGFKDVAKAFPALELYGAGPVLVEQASLSARGLTAEDLQGPVTVIESKALASLLDQARQVFCF